MENPTEDQAMEEQTLALQQSGHRVNTLSLTFQRVSQETDGKSNPSLCEPILESQCLLSFTKEAHSRLPRGCSQRAQDSGEHGQ